MEKKIFVFDVDCTLTNASHRQHHVRQKPKRWDWDWTMTDNDVSDNVLTIKFRKGKTHFATLAAMRWA